MNWCVIDFDVVLVVTAVIGSSIMVTTSTILGTYPPGPHMLGILPNTQVEYWQRYSTFSTDFT